MVPLRDATTIQLLIDFKDAVACQTNPIFLLKDGRALGEDDWDGNTNSPQIECWWGVFGRKPDG